MGELVLTTYDWVPEFPRGYVRDLRARWALEEAGLPYRMAYTPFDNRPADMLAHQPFNQVPWLTDSGVNYFESGAIVLHIAGKSDRLLPADPKARAEAVSWLFAAVNSMEPAIMPWFILSLSPEKDSGAMSIFAGHLQQRLDRLEAVVASRDWLAGAFSAADIMTADALRLADRLGGLSAHPACKAYVDRATARPAFRKAHADQMAHFAAADGLRAG